MYNSKKCYAEHNMMLSVAFKPIVLSVIMIYSLKLIVIMQSVTMLIVAMLSVVAPC